MKFKGWGTSLAWWANVNYPENIKHQISELLFGESGLHLNIVRYNLGATNPLNEKIKAPRMMPCIKNGIDQDFNLENDKLQLSILDTAVKLGVNYVEIFANSPPWWMTSNGASGGSNTIATNNLKNNNIDDYVDFLIDSYYILKEKYPITTLEPFNEPSNPFWTSDNGQEGCYFDFNLRNKIIKRIKEKDQNIKLAAADSFSIGFAFIWHLFSHKHLIDQINVHGYHLNWKGYTFYLDDLDFLRYCFRNFVHKPIWMTEFGMGGPDTITTALQLAKQIFRDLSTLKPEAWIYWQVIEDMSPEGWGLIHIPFNNPIKIKILKQYWVMMHFTKTLREGDVYNFINNKVIQIKNEKGKLAYIVLGETSLSSYHKLNIKEIRLTDETNDYKSLNFLPKKTSKECIISFFVSHEK